MSTVRWQAVANQSDAEHLMQIAGSFHDGCVREVHIFGGYFVKPDLSMICPNTPDLKCRVLVQRQSVDHAVMELFFDRVSAVLLAAPAGFDRIISSATLTVEVDRIVWSPDRVWDESKSIPGNSSGIVAGRMWWRDVPDGFGRSLMYGDAGDFPQEVES